MRAVLEWLVPLGAGAIVGSFLNVAIYRIPRKLSLFNPRSFCPHCSKRVRWYDNIPIFSYLILRGRCRDCGGGISLRYPVVEVVAAVLTAGLVNLYGFGWAAIGFVVLSYLLVAIAFVDFEHLIVPNELIAAGVIFGLVFLFAGGLKIVWQEGLLGGLLMGGFLWGSGALGKVVFRKESMGMGDVKLGFMAGIFIGWQWGILALFITFVVAGIFGLAGVAAGKLKLGQRVPFGPFLSLGTITTLFTGDWIIQFYTAALGFQ